MKRLRGIGIGLLVAVLLFSGVATASSVTKSIDVTYRDIKLVIAGREFIPKDVNGNIVEPFIYSGTTYVPIRAVSQALGWRVSWDGKNSTVYIGINNDPVIWRADLNHDGIDDKIIVEPYIRDSGADLGAIISVYKGDSNLLLYSSEINIAHVGWNGFYLYHDGDDAYLFNWSPAIFQGDGCYLYDIFSFSESGEKLVFDSGSYEFDCQDLYDEHKGIGEFVSFVQKVNDYLNQSYLLADTDMGELKYGTPDDPHAEPFIPEWLFIR